MPVVRTEGPQWTVTWLSNFLVWVDYFIFLPMVPRWRASRKSFANILSTGFFQFVFLNAIVSTKVTHPYWRPSVNKIRFNKSIYHVHLIHVCRKEKGLLNFVIERIKLVYRIDLLGTALKKQAAFQTSKLKPQFIGRILPRESPYLRGCLHGGRKILEGGTTLRWVYMQKFRYVWCPNIEGSRKK